jgi:CRP/FNR family transcriptional regulator, cyclic AMP receptor protein
MGDRPDGPADLARADRLWGTDWPLLAGLDAADRHELLAMGRRRQYLPGQVVYHAGDAGDSLHLVGSGRVAVWVSLPTEATAMIHVFGPGDFFGESALLRPGSRRPATVRALDEAETLVLTEPVFRVLSERRPQLHRFVTGLSTVRMEALSTRLYETMYLGLDHRLRARLRDLVGVYEANPDGSVTIPLNQSQVADLVGGTRPTVNQALQRLADTGLVVLARGRVEVPRPREL